MSGPPDDAPLAVIVVNYQSYDELRDCLTSLRAAGDHHQVVVVDHASETAAADALTAAFPEVRFLRVAANEGFAAGVNRGARAAAGSPFILLLNPDCVVQPATCDALLAWMRAHAEVGAAGPRILNADGTLQPTARKFPDLTTGIAGRSSWLTRVLPKNPLSRHNLLGREEASEALDVDWVSGACLIARRDAFESIGGMDEGFFLYWEDADFCRRLHQAGWRIVYVPSVTITHVGGRSSRHSKRASLEAFHRSAFRLYWKHASSPARLLAPLVFGALRVRLMVMKQIVRRRARAAQQHTV